MLTRVVFAAGILCLILPASGFAQGFSQGDKTFDLSGTGVADKDFDNSSFSFQGALIRQDLAFADVGESSWNAATRVALEYNFDMGRVWPFVGAGLGYVYGDDVHDTWVGGIQGGARAFVNQTTYILGMAEYEWLFDSDNSEGFGDGRWVFSLGIGFRWQ
jgi:hypothetical protein